MTLRNSTLAFVAAAVTTFAALPAHAVDRAPAADSVTHSVTVRYHASDLNSSAGADRLLSRVSGAAAKVCTIPGSPAYDFLNGGFRSCRQAAIERAVEQVGRRTLTAAYNQTYPEDRLPVAAAQTPRRAATARRKVG